MQPVKLGNTGLFVSPICLGTMTFGGRCDEAEAARIADAALDAGVFFWDTADMYTSGASEGIVGRLAAGRRDRLVLATKAYADMGGGANDRGLSARHLIEACEASLRRLNTDWIDLYYLHVPDDGTPIEESLRAMEDLRRSGKVRYIAASNYRAWQVCDMWHVARDQGWAPVSAVQPLYNLANRDIEGELLPMCEAKGIGVVSYSPLARGVLTNKYAGGQAPADSRLAHSNARFLRAEWRAESVAVAAALARLAETRGCTTSQLATAWALANRNIDSVIIGPRTLNQALDGLGAADVTWDAELEEACDALVAPGAHTGPSGSVDTQYYPVTGRRT